MPESSTQPPAGGDWPAQAGVILVCVAPFALLPGMFDRWVFPKLLLVVVGAGFALFARPAGKLPRWVSWWLLAVGAVLAAGAMLGAAPLPQLFGRWPRYEGAVALPVYVLAAWSGARLLGGDAPPRRVRTMWMTTSLAALVAAVIAVTETFGVHLLATTQARPGSVFGNASDQGVVGAVVVAMLLPMCQRRLASVQTPGAGRSREAGIGWVGLCSGIVLVATSASRAAMLALLVVLATHLVLLWRRGRSEGRRRAWLLPVGLAAIGAILVGVLPMARSRLTGASALSQETVTNRWTMWRATAELLRGDLGAGVGPSGFSDAVNAVLPENWFATVGEGAVLESPHNIVAQVASAGGVVGLVAVLVFAAWLVRETWVRRHSGEPAGSLARADLREGAVLAVLGWAVALLTHFTSPGNIILPAVLMGALLAGSMAVPSAGEASARGVRERGVTWWVAAVVVCAWAVGLAGGVTGDFALNSGTDAVQAGRADAADSAFSSAQRLRPWDADVPLIAAESFAGALDGSRQANPKMVTAAQRWSELAMVRLPGSTRALKAGAVADQYAGDVAGAIGLLDRAASLSPTDPQVFQRLGALQAVTGDVPAGLKSLEWAAHLDPGDEGIQQTLTYVRGLPR
jgi:hypothetical protein